MAAAASGLRRATPTHGSFVAHLAAVAVSRTDCDAAARMEPDNAVHCTAGGRGFLVAVRVVQLIDGSCDAAGVGYGHYGIVGGRRHEGEWVAARKESGFNEDFNKKWGKIKY